MTLLDQQSVSTEALAVFVHEQQHPPLGNATNKLLPLAASFHLLQFYYYL